MMNNKPMQDLSKHEAFWTKKLTWEPLWNRKFGGPGTTRFKTLAIFRGRIAFYVLTTPFHSLTCPLRLESSRSCQWLTRLKPKAVRGRWHTPIIFAYIHFNIFRKIPKRKSFLGPAVHIVSIPHWYALPGNSHPVIQETVCISFSSKKVTRTHIVSQCRL